MKKRILSFVLVFAILCTMTISASASSASSTGETGGGPLGKAPTSATLNVYTEHATAETQCSESGFTYTTSVRLYFIDGDSIGNSGGASVSVWKSTGIDIPNTSYAVSYHSVSGNLNYGSWSTSLRANVW